MDHIWEEMTEWLLQNFRDMFSPDYAPEDIVAALTDAWGQDRAAAVWTTEDVLDRATEIFEIEITTEDARGILPALIASLEGINGFDILDDEINELFEDNYDNDI